MADIRLLESHPPTCGFFLHKENRCNDAIEIALLIIAAAGIAVFVTSYFSIPASAGYFGISASVISLLALKVFRSYSSSELDREIDACKSFSDIEAIFTKSTTKVSLFGTRQLTATGINGTSTLDYLALKLEKEVASHLIVEPVFAHRMTTGKTFSYTAEEAKILPNLVTPIFNLFDALELKISTGNIFTRICYWTPRFFKAIADYNDVRSRYDGLGAGMRGTVGPPYDLKTKGKDYMPPRFGFID